ncbi:MAG: DUF559 domain-containing protein [Deltaproteobacteria bacterium]|nr:DUF559 domain-containing protein [Deltaproteobacteria bacterium]
MPMHSPAVGSRAARVLRRRMTLAEQVLWRELRRKQVGAPFRRQAPLSGFVLDFYAPSVRLAVEVDGPAHHGTHARDQLRDALLATQGIEVLRFTNEEVLLDLKLVVHKLRNAVLDRT